MEIYVHTDLLLKDGLGMEFHNLLRRNDARVAVT